MSKRRSLGDAPEAAAAQELTPEERRAQRRRDRARRKAGRPPTASRPWRRYAVAGAVVGVVGIVAAVLIVSNLPSPCISLGPIPSSSGVPAFPPHTTTDFSNTWCPGSAAEAYGITVQLSITVSGTAVTFPTSIGRNASYPNHYDCQLPIFTQSPTVEQLPSNQFQIISDWFYTYNLSTFFDVWAESYPAVSIPSNPSAPITYTGNVLFGLSANATHRIELFVDNQPSSAGPSLAISTLDYSSVPYPTCLSSAYGTGHTIALVYKNASAGAVVPFDRAAADVTAPSDPYANLLLADGPMPHFGFLEPMFETLSKGSTGSLGWLTLRPFPT